MRNMLTKCFIWLPPYLITGVVTAAILWLTLAPKPFGDSPMPNLPGLDKVVHACMFGALMFVAELDYTRHKIKQGSPENGVASLIPCPAAIFIALAVIAFGGAIELTQQAMGLGRGADWLDFLADAVGVAAAYALSPRIIKAILNLQA